MYGSGKKISVLVTGANGFIGSHVCKKLLEDGFDVKALVRRVSDISSIKDMPIKIEYGSLNDIKDLRNVVKNVKIVIHLAAVMAEWGKKEYFEKVNVCGTRTLLDACLEENVKRFVFISSVAVEDFLKSKYKRYTLSKIPVSFSYALTKFEAEKIVMDYHDMGNISASIVRPCTVFGPGNPVTFNILNCLKSGRMIYTGKGDIFVPYSYVENLADAIALIAKNDSSSGKYYTVTDGIKITQKEFYEKICNKRGTNLSSIYIDIRLSYVIAWFLENVYRFFNIKSKPPQTLFNVFSHRNCSFKPLDENLKELGYEPKIKINEAVEKCISWYNNETKNI